METVSRAGARDMIALTWFQLGYRPRESLVMIGTRGPRCEAGPVLRIDLPPDNFARRELDAVARRLGRTLRRLNASGAATLVFSERALEQPRPRIVASVITALRTAEVESLDVYGIGRDRYRSLLCHDPACCPPAGKPLDEVLSSRTAMAFVLAGQRVPTDELAVIADVLPAIGGSAERCPERVVRDSAAAPLDRGHWWRQWLALLGADQPAAELAAGLAEALHDPLFRDGVLVHLAGLRDQLAEQVAVAATRGQAARMLEDGGAADLGRLLRRPPPVGGRHRAEAVLAAAARFGAPGRRAPALAVLSWLAWLSGKGARARLLVDLALADDPANRLAGLVGGVLGIQVPPPWVDARNIRDVG